jgi:hypothetical protein
MMQAAQLAAEAAMQEAAAREANSGRRQATMDMDASNASLGMDSEQLAFLEAMQAAEMGDQANLMQDINMMGLNQNDNSVQSLLHMLTQQEQENARPDEHYLTIAQNGKYYWMHYSSFRVRYLFLIF